MRRIRRILRVCLWISPPGRPSLGGRAREVIRTPPLKASASFELRAVSPNALPGGGSGVPATRADVLSQLIDRHRFKIRFAASCTSWIRSSVISYRRECFLQSIHCRASTLAIKSSRIVSFVKSVLIRCTGSTNVEASSRVRKRESSSLQCLDLKKAGVIIGTNIVASVNACSSRSRQIAPPSMSEVS